MRTRLCPHCGKPVPIGQPCPRCCSASRRHGTRSREQEGRRADENPWRSGYSSAEYRRARQEVIERQQGRCAACGRVVAVRMGRQWHTRGGGVHHLVALSEGGTNSPENLVLLCTRCHNRIDAERRSNGSRPD